MSKDALISGLIQSFSAEGQGDPITDATTHANAFATAVHTYLLTLKDMDLPYGPGAPVTAVQAPFVAALIANPAFASPGVPDEEANALKAASGYATAFDVYFSTWVGDVSVPVLSGGGIVYPPGTRQSCTLTKTTYTLDITNEFKKIFLRTFPSDLGEDLLKYAQASAMADAIEKAFTEGVSITISGEDNALASTGGLMPNNQFTLESNLQ